MEASINDLSKYMNELIRLTNDNKITWSKTIISRGNKTYNTNIGGISIVLQSTGGGKSFKISGNDQNTIRISENEYGISTDLTKLIETVDQNYVSNRLLDINNMLKKAIDTINEEE